VSFAAVSISFKYFSYQFSLFLTRFLFKHRQINNENIMYFIINLTGPRGLCHIVAGIFYVLDRTNVVRSR